MAALLALITVTYFLAAWIGSSIPRNSEWSEPDRGVEIMVESNGTHTGIVVPVTNAIKDWRETFPSAGHLREDDRYPTHVAIGWGEAHVFMNVPTWGDLSPLTALRIAFVGGDSMIRLSHYIRPAPGENHRPLRVTSEQYRRIVEQVEASLPPAGGDGERTIFRGTDRADAYYEARGRYTLLKTSNSWTGDLLGDAGIRMGLWTPLAGGVMKWIDKPREER